MDSAGQAIGQKRVLRVLVEPLERRGLARPSSITKSQYGEMIDDLCARLAYMSEINLAALGEQVAASPGGKDQDRMPIANRILEWAAVIQPPSDEASPLIRAVFSNALGQDALRDGWAPELLFELRRNRRWPNGFVVSRLREKAADSVRQLESLQEKLLRGELLSQAEDRWRARRKDALKRCQRIADLAVGAGE